MKIRLYILLCISLAAAWQLSGQNLVLQTAGALYPETLSSQDRETVVETINDFINDYADAAPLLDKKLNKVTSESVNRFKNMFLSNATLVKDYEEFVTEESIVELETYYNDVANTMEVHGLQVVVAEPLLAEIKDDGNFWVARVRLQKEFYNYIDTDNQVRESTGGRSQEQELWIDITKNNLKRARIQKIIRICRPGECEVQAEYTSYKGGYLGGFLPLVVGKSYGGWLADNPGAVADFSVTGKYGAYFGLEYLTNRINKKEATGKNTFLSLGLSGNFSHYSASIENYGFTSLDEIATVTPGGTPGEPYTRTGSGINATEQFDVISIQAPIGVGFRFKKKQMSELIFQAKMLPSYFLLYGEATLESTSGKYKTDIFPAEFNSSRADAINPDNNALRDDKYFGPFLIGDNRTIRPSETDLDVSGFGIAAQLSPTAFFHLSDNNPNWSLMIGADVTYHIGSFVKFSGDDNILLKYPNDDDYSNGFFDYYNGGQSLVGHYLSSLSVTHIGFRIGLLRRFVDNP